MPWFDRRCRFQASQRRAGIDYPGRHPVGKLRGPSKWLSLWSIPTGTDGRIHDHLRTVRGPDGRAVSHRYTASSPYPLYIRTGRTIARTMGFGHAVPATTPMRPLGTHQYGRGSADRSDAFVRPPGTDESGYRPVSNPSLSRDETEDTVSVQSRRVRARSSTTDPHLGVVA